MAYLHLHVFMTNKHWYISTDLSIQESRWWVSKKLHSLGILSRNRTCLDTHVAPWQPLEVYTVRNTDELIMSLMLLTRPESVTTTVGKRAVTCRCLSHSKNNTIRLGEASRHLILAAEGLVSQHFWPGLDCHGRMKTTRVTRVFCLSGQMWQNRSNGPLCRSPIFTDLNVEAILFWGHRGLVHVPKLFMNIVQKKFSCFPQESVSVMEASSVIFGSSWCLARTGRLV